MFESARIWVESDARNRPRPHTFYPPKGNRLVCWLSKQIAARSVRDKLKVVDVSISDDDLARLRDLRGQRCLVMPSHSGGFEPYVIMDLTRKLDVNCYYLAAIEAFERNPLIGWFMQRSGAYSIIRGTADRLSFQTTRKVLAEGRRWLVVFPEGQTVWQNDTVMPFQEGVTQLAFKGLEDARSDDPEASLFCIPMAIKYVYLQPMDAEIEASLTRLEDALFDDLPTPPPVADRLRRISEAVLVANEAKHGVTSRAGDDLDARIQRMKEVVVRDIEAQLELVPRADVTLLDRIRVCFNAVDTIVSSPPEPLRYLEKLQQERRQAACELYDDLWRVLQFVAIYEGYVEELASVERLMDVLCLLEMEVLGERRMWGPRRAILRVGEALDLGQRMDAYRANKRRTVSRVSLELESSVRSMLEAMALAHSCDRSDVS